MDDHREQIVQHPRVGHRQTELTGSCDSGVDCRGGALGELVLAQEIGHRADLATPDGHSMEASAIRRPITASTPGPSIVPAGAPDGPAASYPP